MSEEGMSVTNGAYSEMNPFEDSFIHKPMLSDYPSLMTPPIHDFGSSLNLANLGKQTGQPQLLPLPLDPALPASDLPNPNDKKTPASAVTTKSSSKNKSDGCFGLNLLAEADTHSKDKDGRKTPQQQNQQGQQQQTTTTEKARTPGASKQKGELPNNESGSSENLNSGDSSIKKRRYSTKEMSPEEKRRIYLERNKAAAAKCRSRKKQWLQETQEKNEQFQKMTAELRVQLARLKSEQTAIKEQLRTRPCTCGRMQQLFESIEAAENQHHEQNAMLESLQLNLESESMNLQGNDSRRSMSTSDDENMDSENEGQDGNP